ncbi:MAG: aminotransferase class III-fold pyridoxal phosphate-dependent enzyme [Dehalococcoidia bacterium]
MARTVIEDRYYELHPKSAELYERAKLNFPKGVTHEARNMSPFPVHMTHGAGSRKWDVDGNEYVEYNTGHGSMILGQAHPVIVKAVQERMALGTHLSASSDLEIRWADLVKELIPCAEKVRFTSSGTEAVMMAMRMARAYTGRSKVIKFFDHFHGWSDYANAGGLTGMDGIPDNVLETMIVLQPGDIGAVETAIQNNDVAAIIIESTGAHMGGTPIHPDFLQGIRDLATKYGVVFILDEVVTGFRASKGGTQELWGITPDMCTLAKILGGGLPGGAVAGKADILNTIERGQMLHQGTFNGNPLSAVAGIAALEMVANGDVNEKADAVGQKLKMGINEVFGRVEIPGHAYGIGSMIHTRIGIDAEVDEYGIIQGTPSGTPINSDADHEFKMAMFNNGVDNGRRFLTMAVHTDEDIDRTLEAFENSLKQVRAQGMI